MFSAAHRSTSASSCAVGQVVEVLDGTDRRDRLRLGELAADDAAQAEVADQALLLEFGQRAELLGDRLVAGPLVRGGAQVHHIEDVQSEVVDVVLSPGAGGHRHRATAYLLSLAGTPSADGCISRSRAATGVTQVPANIVNLISGWPTNPAYVQNRFTDILAVNPLCAALSPHYAVGVNLLRAVLPHPAEQNLRADWNEATQEGVASLRANAGSDVDSPRFVELVGELSVRSDRFHQLWGRVDVLVPVGRTSRVNHPQVGEIELWSTARTA